MAYEKHNWNLPEFQKGDQKFIDNLNHMEDGIGGVSDKYVKEAVVDNDRATIEFTDQDGNKTTYYPITAESGTTKAYVDDGDASVTVTPLSSLVGVEYEEDEIRGFRIGDPSGEAGTGVSYKIRETARAEELPSELTSPMTWAQFCTTLQGLIDQYADQFRGRTYQGNIIITSGFPGQGSSQVGLAISSTIINDYAAKIDIYSTTIQPYHWEMHTKIGGTPNTVPQAIITCDDTTAERNRSYEKEMRFRVNNGIVEQIWQPSLLHDGGFGNELKVKSDHDILVGYLTIDGIPFGIVYDKYDGSTLRIGRDSNYFLFGADLVIDIGDIRPGAEPSWHIWVKWHRDDYADGLKLTFWNDQACTQAPQLFLSMILHQNHHTV